MKSPMVMLNFEYFKNIDQPIPSQGAQGPEIHPPPQKKGQISIMFEENEKKT